MGILRFAGAFAVVKQQGKCGRKIYVAIYIDVIRRVLLFPLLILPCLIANISNFSQSEISCKHTRRVLWARHFIWIVFSLAKFYSMSLFLQIRSPSPFPVLRQSEESHMVSHV
ncbi:MAG: hypothetical protein H6Q19_1250 [Bacteroidetes bacterium]|nr:hypothetical protein [Bacteroidota bacterium]